MSYRLRIAAWVVLSASLIILAMAVAGYMQMEEELREGRNDPDHPRNPGWTLHNSVSEAEIEEILGEMTRAWLWTAIPLISLSLGAGLLLARRSLLPVREINRQLATMRPDALQGDIAITEADPAIAGLASHLNVLLDRAGNAYREMAEFSSRVAHELRTPLMLLRLRLENAPPGMPPAFQEELQDELARLSRFVERSLLAVKAEQGTLQPVEDACDLGGIVRDVADSYQLLVAERGLEMTVDSDAGVEIVSDADLLRQALHGLMENAVRYAASQLRVTCRGGAKPALEIDNDCNPDTIAPGGLGLGLRLVTGICKACGWSFETRATERGFHASIRFA
jgi:signal transduction histidine kinase